MHYISLEILLSSPYNKLGSILINRNSGEVIGTAKHDGTKWIVGELDLTKVSADNPEIESRFISATTSLEWAGSSGLTVNGTVTYEIQDSQSRSGVTTGAETFVKYAPDSKLLLGADLIVNHNASDWTPTNCTIEDDAGTPFFDGTASVNLTTSTAVVGTGAISYAVPAGWLHFSGFGMSQHANARAAIGLAANVAASIITINTGTNWVYGSELVKTPKIYQAIGLAQTVRFGGLELRRALI